MAMRKTSILLIVLVLFIFCAGFVGYAYVVFNGVVYDKISSKGIGGVTVKLRDPVTYQTRYAETNSSGYWRIAFDIGGPTYENQYRLGRIPWSISYSLAGYQEAEAYINKTIQTEYEFLHPMYSTSCTAYMLKKEYKVELLCKAIDLEGNSINGVLFEVNKSGQPIAKSTRDNSGSWTSTLRFPITDYSDVTRIDISSYTFIATKEGWYFDNLVSTTGPLTKIDEVLARKEINFQGYYGISGKVVDSSGVGIPSVLVTIYNKSGAKISAIETDANGDFTFQANNTSHLVSGLVTVKLEKEGYNFSENNISIKEPVKLSINGKQEPSLVTNDSKSNVNDSNLSAPSKRIAIGQAHIVAVTSGGSVSSTGSNDFGQCNTGNWHEIIAVAAGNNHTVGLDSIGNVLAVGDDSSGQCNVEGWSDISDIACGYSYTIGLKKNGTVLIAGQLANGLSENSKMTDIVAVAAGLEHFVGLKRNGTVVAIGSNEYGQCNVEKWQGIIAIAAGYYHTIGLKADGTVVAIGFNGDKQIEVSDWAGIISVASSKYCSVGLTSTGKVNLACSSFSDINSVLNWSDIIGIAAGDSCIAAIKSNGGVIVAGDNSTYMTETSKWMDITIPYRVTGTVKNGIGVAIEGVTVSCSEISAVTDASGFFSIEGLRGICEIIPQKEGYSFSPEHIETSLLRKHVDFVSRYCVSGVVSFEVECQADLSGIAMNHEGITVYSDIKGAYRFDNIDREITISPQKPGYRFYPKELVLSRPNKSANFTAYFVVEGKVTTSDNAGIPSVEVINGETSVLTDTNGHFEITIPGPSVLSIVKKGYSFKPQILEIKEPLSGISVEGALAAIAPVQPINDVYLVERLTTDGQPKSNPKLSPNGSKLVYAVQDMKEGNEFSWSIYAFDMENRAAFPVTDEAGTDQPAWLPNNDEIVYLNFGIAQKPLLAIRSISGGGEGYIGNMIPIGDYPQYPDVDSAGRLIVLQTRLQNKEYIFSINIDGSNMKKLTEGSQPNWNSDGTEVLYTRTINSYSQLMIWTYTNRTTLLTDGKCNNLFPSYSPDGQWISFISDRDGGYQLYLMKVDGNEVTQLTRGEAEIYYCNWGADGWIYFVSDSGSSMGKVIDPTLWIYSDIWRLNPLLK